MTKFVRPPYPLSRNLRNLISILESSKYTLYLLVLLNRNTTCNQEVRSKHTPSPSPTPPYSPPSSSPSPPSGESEEVVRELWKVYLKEVGNFSPPPKYTYHRRELIQALYDELLVQASDPVEAFRWVCKALADSDFHSSQRMFLLPESFLKSEERRERWFYEAVDMARSDHYDGGPADGSTAGRRRYEEWDG